MNKQRVKEMIDKMPKDSTFEDIQYTIYVQSKIQKGLDAIDNRDVLSQEEVEKRIEKWFKH